MLTICLHSLRLHADLLRRTVQPGQHHGAPLTWRRGLTLAAALPPYLSLQGLHWLCLAADEWLYPDYHAVELESPLFILGIPRSGTTFAHRSLADAAPDMTTMRTWEALFAPSIVQRKFWHGVAKIDARLGGWGRRALNRATGALAGGLEDVHSVGLDAAEEDYLALLPAGACFFLSLAFPFQRELWQLGTLNRDMPPPQRQALVRFYRGLLQRHLFVHGPDARLLSKNAAFASWAGALAEELPDARFIVCLREPQSALASQLSSIQAAVEAFGSDREVLARELTDMFDNAYAHLHEQVKSDPQRYCVIDMQDLRAAPGRQLLHALEALGIPVDNAMHQALAALASQDSRHHHNPSSVAASNSADLRGMQAHYQALTNSPLAEAS